MSYEHPKMRQNIQHIYSSFDQVTLLLQSLAKSFFIANGWEGLTKSAPKFAAQSKICAQHGADNIEESKAKFSKRQQILIGQNKLTKFLL